MYYCLSCPPKSLIVFARHSLLVRQFSSPLLSVCHLHWFEVTCILSMWRGTANHITVCAYSPHQYSYFQFTDVGGLRPYIFQSVYLFLHTIYLLLLSRDSVN